MRIHYYGDMIIGLKAIHITLHDTIILLGVNVPLLTSLCETAQGINYLHNVIQQSLCYYNII